MIPRWKFEPFAYSADQVAVIREALRGAGIDNEFELRSAILPALCSVAGDYLADVHHDRALPDYQVVENMRSARRDANLAAIEDMREWSCRNEEICAGLDQLAEVPERFLGDSGLLAFAEALIAGKVKPNEFEREIFHRVLDRYEQYAKGAWRPLRFENSHKDKRAPRSKEPGPVFRFRRQYIARVFLIWIEWGHEKIISDIHALAFTRAACEPVLAMAKQPLKERTIENILNQIRKEYVSKKET